MILADVNPLLYQEGTGPMSCRPMLRVLPETAHVTFCRLFTPVNEHLPAT